MSKQNMTPAEDALAELLVAAGLNAAEAGAKLGRSENTVMAAVDRSRAAAKRTFTNKQVAKAKAIVGFERWLAEGRKEGYLETLTAYVESLDTYKGRGGVGGVRTRYRGANGA